MLVHEPQTDRYMRIQTDTALTSGQERALGPEGSRCGRSFAHRSCVQTGWCEHPNTEVESPEYYIYNGCWGFML